MHSFTQDRVFDPIGSYLLGELMAKSGSYWVCCNLDSELEKTPNGVDVLWEGVLALWWLKLVEDRKFDSSW